MTEIGHHVKIGDGVRIHSRCFIPEYTEICDGAWIMPGVIITDVKYPRCPKVKTCDRGFQGVLVRENAIIGAGVLILPGIEIGTGALVAAGAVVTKDVLPGEVVRGFPAERHKRVVDLECPKGIEDLPYGADWTKD
jgi:acetyltransferase-like isoleucine patch superfamily enzyme